MVMHELRDRAFKKAFKEKTMKRVMLHTYHGRMRYFFDKWKHQKNQLALAEEVNVSKTNFYCTILISLDGRRRCP